MSRDLEQGLFSVLTGNSPQTSAAGRVYPRLPQGVTMPCVHYQRIGATRNQAITGNVGVTKAVVQLNCIGDNYSDSKLLADEVRAILHGFSGAWGSLTAHNVVLQTEHDAEYQSGDDISHWVVQRYAIYTNMD